MKRLAFLVAGAIAVALSYLATLMRLGSDPAANLSTAAAIALPALVAGFVTTAYIAWDIRRARNAQGAVSELSAQLVRKEIELDRLSTVDELTGLHARHHFDEMVGLELERAVRHRRALSLLLIEIDDMAELGEHAGKLSRGYLLSEIGAILRTMLRANDLGARYTADTLAVLLPETDGSKARLVANKVRGLVAAHEFLGQRFGGSVRVTVSQGIAAAPASDIESPQGFVRAAEAALASAKVAGTDCVRLHESPPAAIDGTAGPLAS